MRRRWLFADQLGPRFLDAPEQPVLLVESKAVFRRRVFHRQKAQRQLDRPADLPAVAEQERHRGSHAP